MFFYQLDKMVPLFILIFTNACLSFHQDEYRIVNERSQLIRYNKEYSDNVTFALSLVNRTTRAFNFRAHLLIECGMDVVVVTQFYKFLSNEYRYFPVKMSLNVCRDVLENGLFGFDDLPKHSNAKLCPFKKGWYFIKDFIPDYTKWPPHVPYGKYKAEVEFYHKTEFVLELHWYVKVEEIIRWKN